MTLVKINEKISILEKQLETINNQMRKICDNRDVKMSVMSQEYYKLLKERQCIEVELRPLWNEQSRLRCKVRNQNSQKETFINSYGEATKREITSTTYQRAQKRMEQTILSYIGA